MQMFDRTWPQLKDFEHGFQFHFLSTYPPRGYVRTHFDVFLPGTFLKIFRTYPHMRGDAPPTCGAESSEWVFARKLVFFFFFLKYDFEI